MSESDEFESADENTDVEEVFQGGLLKHVSREEIRTDTSKMLESATIQEISQTTQAPVAVYDFDQDATDEVEQALATKDMDANFVEESVMRPDNSSEDSDLNMDKASSSLDSDIQEIEMTQSPDEISNNTTVLPKEEETVVDIGESVLTKESNVNINEIKIEVNVPNISEENETSHNGVDLKIGHSEEDSSDMPAIINLDKININNAEQTNKDNITLENVNLSINEIENSIPLSDDTNINKKDDQNNIDDLSKVDNSSTVNESSYNIDNPMYVSADTNINKKDDKNNIDDVSKVDNLNNDYSNRNILKPLLSSEVPSSKNAQQQLYTLEEVHKLLNAQKMSQEILGPPPNTHHAALLLPFPPQRNIPEYPSTLQDCNRPPPTVDDRYNKEYRGHPNNQNFNMPSLLEQNIRSRPTNQYSDSVRTKKHGNYQNNQLNNMQDKSNYQNRPTFNSNNQNEQKSGNKNKRGNWQKNKGETYYPGPERNNSPIHKNNYNDNKYSNNSGERQRRESENSRNQYEEYGNVRGNMHQRNTGNSPESVASNHSRSSPQNRGPGGQGKQNWYSPKDSNRSYRPAVTPTAIIAILSKSDQFSASLAFLERDRGLHSEEVQNVITQNPNIFQWNQNKVALCLKVEICLDHISSKGCGNLGNCHRLHLCHRFIAGACRERNCILGHYLKTRHNLPILKEFHIDLLDIPELMNVLQFMLKPKDTCDDLQICIDFNSQKCALSDCNNLHLCLAFLANICNSDGCNLIHNPISNKSSSDVLAKHGFLLNESPRDLLQAITNCIKVKIQINAFKTEKQNSGSAAPAKNSGAKSNDDTGSSSTNTIVGAIKKFVNKDKQVSGGNTPVTEAKSLKFTSASGGATNIAPKKIKTTWSHFLLGDVFKPEICYASVEASCPYEKEGCWRLHSTRHFWWQFKDPNFPWYNVPESQSVTLERAFCDVTIDQIQMDPLKPKEITPANQGILASILMNKTWVANLDKMRLSTKDTQEKLKIRRLCTETNTNKTPVPPCVFRWYFIDDKSNWIEYGKVDSEEKTDLVSPITSKDIEDHLMKDPTFPVVFQNDQYDYMIDTLNFFQTNLSTNKRRPVRRRPIPHLKDDSSSPSAIPKSWEPMKPEEHYKIIPLPQSGQEYKDIVTLISKSSSNFNISKIERVQCPFHLKAYINKVQELKLLHKSDTGANEMQLFHGTGADIVQNICQENFDWRRHGSNVGQAVGRGVYFSNLASTSHGYTRADANGTRYMFVAKVAVGSSTVGNSSMALPPINPITKIPYESTVRQMNDYSVVVKYDRQEYYPQYVIAFT